MTNCTRECPPDCLAQKLEMARRIEDSPKWTAVGDGLPDSIGSYLVYGDLDGDGNFEIAWGFFNSRKEWCDVIGYFHNCVTHWMPLPKAPAHPNQSIGEQK